MRHTIADLKENQEFMKFLRFDITLDDIFKPRFVTVEDKPEETQGFMFYVESMDSAPALMIMKTYNLTSKTIGELVDAPMDLMKASIEAPGVKSYTGMFPINKDLEAWLRGALGITA